MRQRLLTLIPDQTRRFILKLLPEQKQQLWIGLSLCVAAGFIAIFWDHKLNSESPAALQPESVEEAATYIPDGFVLVPIEVANADSLDSILGKFGVVDLYVGAQDELKSRPRKLATRVKILRAPLNPSHFAVLVPDSESQKIVAVSGALTVVVQNPNKSGATLVNPDERTTPPKPHHRLSRVVVEVPDV